MMPDIPRRSRSRSLTIPKTDFPPPSPPLTRSARGPSASSAARSSSWCGAYSRLVSRLRYVAGQSGDCFCAASCSAVSRNSISAARVTGGDDPLCLGDDLGLVNSVSTRKFAPVPIRPVLYLFRRIKSEQFGDALRPADHDLLEARVVRLNPLIANRRPLLDGIGQFALRPCADSFNRLLLPFLTQVFQIVRDGCLRDAERIGDFHLCLTGVIHRSDLRSASRARLQVGR